MLLIPVSERPDAVQILWDLLAERTPEQSISHKAMPAWHEHEMFVKQSPYWSWDLLEVDGVIVGSVYLTGNFEIGISIFKAHQRKGYGTQAAKAIIARESPHRLLANINPANEASRKMWEKLGFKKIQETYSLED